MFAVRTHVIYAIMMSIALQGCAIPQSSSILFAETPRDYVIVTDAVDLEQKFTLELRSMAYEDLCIGVDDWPNALGQVSGGGDSVTLAGGGHVFAATDTNFGYCVGEGCTMHIKPHQVLKGFIGYKQFGEPSQIAALSDKRLIYQIRPYMCGPKRRFR